MEIFCLECFLRKTNEARGSEANISGDGTECGGWMMVLFSEAFIIIMIMFREATWAAVQIINPHTL